jgi:hypothetical protein
MTASVVDLFLTACHDGRRSGSLALPARPMVRPCRAKTAEIWGFAEE